MARTTTRDELFDEDFLRRLRHLALIGRRILARSAGGAHRATDLGDGLEFADHREYSPGDELRYVDWNIFGRLDRMQLRLFHRHSEQQVYLLLDCSGSMAAGDPSKEIYAKRCAAALAYLARANLDHVWISPWRATESQREFAPARGRSSRFTAILDYLAGLEFAGPCSLADSAKRWAAQSRPRGLAVLVSDTPDLDDLRSAVRLIARVSQQVVLLHVCSPQDAGEVPGGPLAMIDPERVRPPVRLIHDAALRFAYQDLWTKYLAHVRATASGVGGVCVQTLTSRHWEQFILACLKRMRMATV